MTKGLDGLSVGMLRTSRAAWWDEAFTRRLLDAAPERVELVVDVGCGLGHAAHALLPHWPNCRYVGLDADETRVRQARTDMETAPYAERASWVVGNAEAMPLESGTADMVLTVMTLQHVGEVASVVREAGRVLRPAGRVVTAEPDNLGQRLYLAEPLEGVTNAVHALCRRLRAARRPADVAIGPRIPALLMAAGFQDVAAVVHAAHRTSIEAPAAFLDRVRGIVKAIAEQAGLAADAPEVIACERALEEARSLHPGAEPTLASHVVPIFISRGTRSAL